MTDNIISLAQKREEAQPHWSGWIRCMHCKHEWVGVAPTGTIDDLECPECKLPRGVIKYNFGAPEGSLVFSCDCGCNVLTAYIWHGKKIIRCLACGNDHTNAVWS
jgi:hypothetical protein